MEISMETKSIRTASINTAKTLGIDVSTTLPLIDPPYRTKNVHETISRILAMNVMAAIAYGFDKTKGIAWLSREKLEGSLSAHEKNFLSKGSGDTTLFKLQIEGMWALAWSIGVVKKLDFAKDCDGKFVEELPNLKLDQGSENLRRIANQRPLKEILEACDLAYCLHSAVQESQITNKKTSKKLKPYVILERRRALDWLLSEESWDEIDLDT